MEMPICKTLSCTDFGFYLPKLIEPSTAFTGPQDILIIFIYSQLWTQPPHKNAYCPFR
jgi:hypothetical protein